MNLSELDVLRAVFRKYTVIPDVGNQLESTNNTTKTLHLGNTGITKGYFHNYYKIIVLYPITAKRVLIDLLQFSIEMES